MQPIKKTVKQNKFEKWLKVALRSGELRPNEKLPSEAELTEKFKLSRMTIKKDLTKFVDLGILVSVHGKGHFVSTHWDKDETVVRFVPIKDGVISSVATRFATKEEEIMPYELKSKLGINYIEHEWDSFVKFYYNNKKEVVAYSINWLSVENSHYRSGDYIRTPDLRFENAYNLRLVESKNFTTAKSPQDMKLFKDDEKYVVTTFSYIYGRALAPLIVRLIKVRVKDFSLDSRILKSKFDL